MGPISALFSSVGVLVFRVVRGVGVNVDISYTCPFSYRPITQLVYIDALLFASCMCAGSI
jgi:hypothetical protein